MDMIAVDLTSVQQAGVDAGFGSEVTLWGRASHGAVLPIDEVALAAGTVGYELMCALAQGCRWRWRPDALKLRLLPLLLSGRCGLG